MVVIIAALAIGVMLGLTLGRYLARQIVGDSRLPVFATIGAGAVGAGGVALIALAAHDLQAGYARRHWPTVQGKILASRVVGTSHEWTYDEATKKVDEEELAPDPNAHRDRNYRPDVTYEYAVDGTRHEQTTHCQVPGFGGKLNRLDVATKMLAEYPVGSSVKVFYNPANPADACLKPGPTWDRFMRVGFGITLLAIGSGVIAASRRRSGA